MVSDGEKRDAGKGFAGLSSLVSDVDTAVTNAKQDASRLSENDAGSRGSATTSQPAPADEPESEHQPHQQVAQQPPSGSFVAKWLLGIGAVVGVLLLFSQGSGKNSPPPTSIANPTVPSAPSVNIEPATNQPEQVPVLPQSSSQSGGQQSSTAEELAARMPAQISSLPQTPRRPIEDMPPVGTNNVLGTAQIRYCLSEDIRLGAAKGVVNGHDGAEVDRFNAMVADFNSRCSQFRYRRGMLESVRSEVESIRGSLQAEGIARFRQQKGSAREQQRENVAITTPAIGGAAAQPEVREPVLPGRHAADTGRRLSLADLSDTEHQSIESACSTDKYVNGPAAYRSCIERHLVSLQGEQRRPDLRNLSSSELQSIESACSTDKYVNGPAAYNTCLSIKLRAMEGQTSRPNISLLSSAERQSIESACSTDKYVNGPAAYNACLARQLSLLRR